MTKYVSFPPASEPENGDWDYLLKVNVSGRLNEPGDKQIHITVEDPEGAKLLSDQFKVSGTAIVVEADWDEFDTIRVELRGLKPGSELSYDADRDDRVVDTRVYAWDDKLRSFGPRQTAGPANKNTRAIKRSRI